ncbi:hypothetical protein ACIGW1_30705 [Streptomyces sp. NPDC053780]|uniref:hypothetical protein n=1 Tax=unclassified Streptomyces TaxID=2593676 RepID=UPI00342BE5DB
MVLFNVFYLDAAVGQPAAYGFPLTDDLLARLSPKPSTTTSTSSAAPPSPGR